MWWMDGLWKRYNRTLEWIDTGRTFAILRLLLCHELDEKMLWILFFYESVKYTSLLLERKLVYRWRGVFFGGFRKESKKEGIFPPFLTCLFLLSHWNTNLKYLFCSKSFGIVEIFLLNLCKKLGNEIDGLFVGVWDKIQSSSRIISFGM